MTDGGPSLEDAEQFISTTTELRRFMMVYKFGLDEMLTKVNILKEELTFSDSGCPIEHVSSRLKSLESLTSKVRRIGSPMGLGDIATNVADIAGIRIVCSFISDVYLVMEMLTRQPDVDLVLVKDYIESPKPNGYKSLHLIVDTPVHMSDRISTARVEIQLRTVAMDFWASLEHKIYYKYDKDVPDALRQELTSAAEIANRLDEKMELLHREVRALERTPSGDATGEAGRA
jgi:putative GTP pyrophosphokinase